ncbi:MAG: DUF808 domain-containing protein [Crocinitomicaceae bacterium]|nr:DUF808 domain-containing protein [Crocinitomicaceae bacterium]
MASGFFALLDDIAALMDDVLAMTKVATKKTAGILADDLAVNAEKASGFVSSRELPVLWAITKGSFLNKIIILPAAFLLSAFLPQAIIPILLFGGAYLGYEGIHKIQDYISRKNNTQRIEEMINLSAEEVLLKEKKKIKSAIFIDFILSIEIIILALGTVINEPLKIQIFVVSIIAVMATIAVYGLVALLVRMDDAGYSLIASSKGVAGFKKSLGSGLVTILPFIIKALGYIGTLAMILVAGGIYHHNIHFIHDIFHSWPSLLADFTIGLTVGLIAFLMVKLIMNLTRKKGH